MVSTRGCSSARPSSATLFRLRPPKKMFGNNCYGERSQFRANSHTIGAAPVRYHRHSACFKTCLRLSGLIDRFLSCLPIFFPLRVRAAPIRVLRFGQFEPLQVHHNDASPVHRVYRDKLYSANARLSSGYCVATRAPTRQPYACNTPHQLLLCVWLGRINGSTIVGIKTYANP